MVMAITMPLPVQAHPCRTSINSLPDSVVLSTFAGPRSGPTNSQAWSWSKLFETLMVPVIMKDFTVILPLPLIQKEQLPVNGERMYTKNWLTVSGRLAQEQCG